MDTPFTLGLKTRVGIFLLALILTFGAVPVFQNSLIANWESETHVEVTGENDVEKAEKESRNKTNSYLGVFWVNMFITVLDAFFFGAICTFLFHISLSSSEKASKLHSYERKSLLKRNSFAFCFTSFITFICLCIAFQDIYFAGSEMAYGFEHLLNKFRDGMLNN